MVLSMVEHRKKRETVPNKKLIHTQNHLNEQVVIELVFLQFLSYEKSRWLLIYKFMLN